jgi:hypothetical protein
MSDIFDNSFQPGVSYKDVLNQHIFLIYAHQDQFVYYIKLDIALNYISKHYFTEEYMKDKIEKSIFRMVGKIDESKLAKILLYRL